MAADETESLKYQYYGLTFKIITGDLVNTNDIQSLSIVRAPIHKIATFAILTCAIDRDTYDRIEDQIRQNIQLTCEITYNRVDKDKLSGTDSTEKLVTKTLFKKTYYIDYCKTVTEASHGTHNSLVPLINFFLVNPSLWYLSNRKRYNAIYENVTAMGALGAIEGWMASDYEDAFNFSDFKIGVNPNSYVYEQLLARTSNDLQAPLNIIKNYKASNDPTYYFFDDFYYVENLTSNFIPVYFVNMTAQKSFQKLDLTERKWRDFLIFNTAGEIKPVNDNTNFFSNDSKVPHTVQLDSNHQSTFAKNLTPVVSIPNFKGKNINSGDRMDYKRFKFNQNFTFQEKEKAMPNDLIRLYSPERDAPGLASARYASCTDFYRNNVHAICTFEAERAYIDVLQFNRIYNLDQNDISDFSYLPIMIVNTFNKVHTSEKYYTHSVKYQCIQFKPNNPTGQAIDFF